MKKYKYLLFFIFSCISLSLFSQETKELVLKTEVSDVTVFINGAQIMRKKPIDLLPGKTKIRFTNLSPYIDAKSVQLKASGSVMVTSVNYQMNYIDSLKLKPTAKPRKSSDQQILDLHDKITEGKMNRDIIKKELSFLDENRKLGGANNGVTLLALKETANYYRERLTALSARDLEIANTIAMYEVQLNAMLNEDKQEGGSKLTPIGEVIVEVECKVPTKANLDLSYYVKNAGWYPSYDIRATSVDKPIVLVYKANIQQNTKEEWNKVSLKVSSSDPNLGNVAPKLQTYYLNYHIAAPRYNAQVDAGEISGIVYDYQNEPLIGVYIVVPGTTIGTLTGVDGRFSLAMPRNAKNLEFTYIGYKKVVMPISSTFMTVYLEEDTQALSEVVVVGYGTQRKKDIVGSISSVGNALAGKVAGVAVRGTSKAELRTDIALPTVQIENQTAVEFEIKIPYTIKSNNKGTMVEVDRYELPADYEYYCIPKINKDAFLLANIADWEQYNLLEGEANIFFEDTYVGKTILDVRHVSDTLNISLGRDKNISVKREKVKDYNTKKFLGTKKEDTRAWKINVRNNKNQAINLVILDQIPVSTNEEIEVNVDKLSGGVVNAETGEVKWRLDLKPSDKKELELKYKVKYPKSRNLTIE